MKVRSVLRRELCVAFSRRAQPIWFRIVKWIIAVSVTVYLWRTPYFWWWIFGGMAAGLIVHFIFRWKTKGWTRPWGGWNDVETASRE